MGSGFGIHPGRQAEAWGCTEGTDGCNPVGFVVAAAAAVVVVVVGGVLRWTEEVVAVGDRIIGDRRIRWSGYDLEDSYGPALYEHEKMRKWD